MMRQVIIPAPVLCACGCGGTTNARTIECARLRNEGLNNVVIGARLGIVPDSVKAALRRPPSRFVNGHQARAGMVDRIEWRCERCGNVGFYSPGQPVPKFCSGHACLAKHGVGMWAPILATVEAARPIERHGADAFTWELAWRLQRRLDTQERDLRALRVRLERLMTMKLRQARRDLFVLEALLIGKAKARERQEREGRRTSQREARRLRSAFSGITTAGARRGYIPRANRSDDAYFSATEAARDGLWRDPVADAVIEQILPTGADFMSYAKAAPIVPDDYVRRCAEGELLLVVDDEGVRFLSVRDRRRDIIPRFDPGVAIPTQAGGMRHRMSSHHRGRNAQRALMTGKRISRKSKTDR